MKILLTGATGFIGSHVARLLVSMDCEVYIVVRKNSDMWRVKDIVPQLHLVRYDLTALEEMKAHSGKIQPDMCIHLAWYAVPGRYLAAGENIDMLTASLHLASYLADIGCKRFIGVGTCFEYDIGSDCLSETSPVKPRTLYSASKLALQVVLEQLADITGMEFAWPRLFYLYGPFESEKRLVPSVIGSLLRNREARITGGEQTRDFLHVEDAASAIWAVAQSKLTGPVNIGSGDPVTVRDVVTRVGAILNKPELIALGALPYSSTDPMFVCANNNRLLENTNWKPRYELESGLRKTIEWWQKHISGER